MIRQRLSLFAVLIIISLLGTSCQSPAPEPESAPAATLRPAPTQTLEPTLSPQPTSRRESTLEAPRSEPTRSPTLGLAPTPGLELDQLESEPMAEPTLKLEPEPSPTTAVVASLPEPPPSGVPATEPPPTAAAVASVPLPPPTEVSAPENRIVVGSKTSTEQQLLGKMLVLKLEEHGYPVTDETGIGGTKPVRDALEAGEIDLYWEYIGTALFNAHNLSPNIVADPDKAFDILRAADEAQGLEWLGRLEFNNPYTLIVPPSTAEEGMETLEELAAFVNAGNSLKVCGHVEFMVDSDGFQNLQGLQEHYEFELREEDALIMPLDQVYKGLRDGKCDVGASLSTDGRIRAGGFHQLSDTKDFFASYHPALVIREELFTEHSALKTTLVEFLEEMRSRLDHTTMSQLNACVDLGADGLPKSDDEMGVEDVARAFLEGETLTCLRRQIVIGSETQTEQLLLRKILLKVLKEEGYSVLEKTLPNRQAAREAIKKGEIDLYWEFTRSALLDDHEIPAHLLPTDPDGAFEMAYSLDGRHFDLLWLAPAAFNETYALLVQPSTVEEGLVTLEDLAQRVNNERSSLRICVSSDFKSDPAGLPGLQERYDFEFGDDDILVMALDESYSSLRKGRCDVAQGLSTDGRIDAWGFHRLEDSERFFTANVAAPVISQTVALLEPELEGLLAQIGVHLDNRQMSRLNAEVDIGADGEFSTGDEAEAPSVASGFVEQKIMPPQIVVGLQPRLVQSLLGKILVFVLEDAGYEVLQQEKEDSDAIRDAINDKKIDVYWELTGSALTGHHNLPPSLFPINIKALFELAKELDSKSGLTWLEPANFDQTYALMGSPETAQEGITTLEQLAEFMNGGEESVDESESTDESESSEESESTEESESSDDSEEEFKICVSNEFYERKHDGLSAVQEDYGFEFKKQNILRMPQDETYSGLRDGRCQVAQGLSTDDPDDSWRFYELEDSRNFFPPNFPAPVIREAFLEKHPKVERLLNQIGPELNEQDITRLKNNIENALDGPRPRKNLEDSFVRSFLCKANLLENNCPKEENQEARCDELLLNGGFESRDGRWELPPTDWSAQLSRNYVRTGDGALLLGITSKDKQKDDVASHSVAKLRLFIPEEAESADLSYWYSPFSEDLNGSDFQGGVVYDSAENSVQQKLLGETSNQQSWTLQQHDLSPFIGEEVYLYFYVTNDGNGLPSAMYLDDVSLRACYDE